MPSISQAIGDRFEDILLQAYPELSLTADPADVYPDFVHPNFFAEAKVAFEQSDYAIHLKEYQVKSFRKIARENPVVYLIGFHNFENTMSRLKSLSEPQRRELLAQEMNVSRFYVVDSVVATKLWRKRNYICKKGHIQDCTVKESHLRQIIQDEEIKIKGQVQTARDFFDVPSKKYSFAMPERRVFDEFEVGHIVRSKHRDIADYFRK